MNPSSEGGLGTLDKLLCYHFSWSLIISSFVIFTTGSPLLGPPYQNTRMLVFYSWYLLSPAPQPTITSFPPVPGNFTHLWFWQPPVLIPIWDPSLEISAWRLILAWPAQINPLTKHLSCFGSNFSWGLRYQCRHQNHHPLIHPISKSCLFPLPNISETQTCHSIVLALIISHLSCCTHLWNILMYLMHPHPQSSSIILT